MKKEIINRNCELCKSLFEVNILSKNKRIKNKRFCSGLCAKTSNGLKNKGKKRSEDFKRDMSIKYTGDKNPFFGKLHSTESKSKISSKNKWSESDMIFYQFTKQQKEIFDGIMISDGSLEKPSRISSRLTLGFKYKETLERIMRDLSNLKYCPIYEYNYIEKRTGNRIINFFSKSHSSNTLLKEYNRWYYENHKIVPIDFKITPLTCYWWYVLDGFIIEESIQLCTDSFGENDLKSLKQKFEENGLYCTISSRKRLRFTKKETIRFFNYIKDIEIQKEYEYKFR